MDSAVEQPSPELFVTTQAQRVQIVELVLEDLARQGVTVNDVVLTLYRRYINGELSLTQVQTIMQKRAEALFLAHECNR